MNAALLKKCLLEVRLLFAACVVLLFAFCFVRVFIVASLELTDFAAIVERLWDKWGKFSPVPLSHLLSYPGRIAPGLRRADRRVRHFDLRHRPRLATP